MMRKEWTGCILNWFGCKLRMGLQSIVPLEMRAIGGFRN